MNEEQKYWSLNGSFANLHKIAEVIDKDTKRDMQQLREYVVSSMTDVNRLMTQYEEK
ncbi:hypothetical protein MNQ98_10700 [Paenibacillus sp. N3/727]|uniref:hypothetical protein n=1 Tax=Paenibacillus sp. N3/727 TaxID=2925845 RepID=UPI001F53713C|nr:hypothetical protein [Paenibacillus sp. N3/727]UNK20443.1 hypothetical protein MNQ98_10700 [Paenibacillus sp. N3/727]